MAEYSLDEDNRKNYRRKASEWDKRKKGWIQRLKENFAPRYQEKINNFETGLTEVKNTDVKVLLEQAQERIEFQRSPKTQSYFSRRDQIIYIADLATESSIAHELFHEIDDTYGISESGILTAPIRKDFRRLNNLARGYGKTIEEMLYSKYPELFKYSRKGKMVFIEKCRGISDILNGMSAGAIKLGYGHEEEYWEKPLRLERETWAQYGRMLYEEEKEVLLVLEDLFPETTQTIQQVLERMEK